MRRKFEGAETLKPAASKSNSTGPTRIPAPVGGTFVSSKTHQAPISKPESPPAAKKPNFRATGTGKGKASVWESPDNDNEDQDEDEGAEADEDEDDEAYLTSHDFEDDHVRAKDGYAMNGRASQ